jgi:2-(1,2-epoxy-1,2-dihydrophenyl)acetyl-CoA isomerase
MTVTLRRPEAGNRLDYQMMMDIARAMERAETSGSIRAVALRGAGEDFCQGDDPDERGPWPEAFRMRASGGPHGWPPVVEQHMLRHVRACPKPTVAILQGKTLGLGLDLAAVCDIRIAADNAEIGDPRILQARHGATGLTYVLPRLIGQSRATWILLTGACVQAEEALRIGLVHQVHPMGELEANTEDFLARLADLPTRSYAVKKEMALAQLDLSFEAAMTHCLAVRQTNVIEDNAEGLAAWRERREPRFTGR